MTSTTLQPLLGAPVTFIGSEELPRTTLTVDDLRTHLGRYGARPVATGTGVGNLLGRFEHAHLSGRGGGHFDVARKWRAHLDTGGDGIVVANASESEPASGKDAALLHLRPHLVIDGLVLAAEAIGARSAVIWLHEDARAIRQVLQRALAERQALATAEPAITIATGPHHYLSGESSAIANALSDGPALPQFRRDPTVRLTIKGQKALVHNVETLAQIALLARSTHAEHRPTTLLTVAAADRRSVLEVPPTTLLTRVVEHVLDQFSLGTPKAVLIGGYGGSWSNWQALNGLLADDRDLSSHGLSMGAGILLPLTGSMCGVRETARIADYMANSSARQCGPCLFGLRAVADLLQQAADLGRSRTSRQKLERYLSEIMGRGGCSHPDGVVRMVASATRVFGEDLQSHLRKGVCLEDGAGARSGGAGARSAGFG